MEFNEKVDEFVPWLAERLTERYRAVAGALVTLAAVPDEKDGLRLATMRWQFSDQPKETRPSRAYRNLRLVEVWLPAAEVTDALAALLAGDATFGDVPVRETFRWVNSGSHYGGSMTGWPEVIFRTSTDHQGRKQVPREPAVSFGLRPYASVTEAINEWVWGITGDRGGSDPQNHGDVVLALPDTRARIAHAEWLPGSVEVRLETNVPSAELELQGVLRAEASTDDEDRFAPSPESRVAWEVPTSAKKVDVYLLHADGSLLERRTLTSPGEEYEPHAGEKTPLAQAQEDLPAGEGQYVEFKPFIKPKDEKEHELLKTVVAFSNQEGGGRLYLGVRDEGVPEGPVGLQKAFAAAPEVAIIAAKEHLNKLLRERVKPVPSFEAHAIEVYGLPVLAVHVRPGSERPYATHENDVFIRKGATSKKADPHTELPRLSGGAGVVVLGNRVYGSFL